MVATIDRHEPVRSCVGCRARRPWSELVRVTRTRAGVVVGGPSAGRGAWVCRSATGGMDPGCCERALRRGGFARAWRGAPNDDDAAAIRGAAAGDDAGDPSVDEGMTPGKG